MMCFAPLILAGYALTLQTAWHHTNTFDAPMLEVQTCERGLGLDAKLTASGLAGIGLQYGLQWRYGVWSMTFQPKAGVSHAMQPVYELPSQTQFEVGALLLGGYQHWRVGVEYWHLSNAGLARPNIGVDLVALLTGYAF